MRDTDKTKEQLINELAHLRHRIMELEASESERKWAEQELRESQERYRSLTEASPIGIFHSDSHGDFLYVNERWAEITGLSPEEAHGKGWQNALHPDDKKSILTEWYQSCQEKRPFKSEFRFQPSEGISVWVLSQSSVERNPNGEVIGYIGTITDITYCKQVEEAIRESEEKYRELVDTSADGVISIDQQMRTTLLNPRAEKMFGYTEKEMIGQSLMKIVPEVHRKAMEKGFAEFQKSGSGPVIGKSIEIEALKKDRTEFPIELSISSRRAGDTYVATALIRDISERKREEEKLRSSEERLRILFEYAPDGYYLNDFKGNFVDGNRAAEELTGYKRDELIGKSFLKLKLLSPKEIPKAAARLAKNALGQPTGPDEFTLNRKDGSQIVVEIRTFPVKIKGKALVLGNVRDITKRKKAEEQLNASLEEKEILLKEIHHRVKNNMQIIASLLRIQAAEIEDEKIQDMFNGIHDRIRSMAVLYEMLYQSKDMATVDLSEYIRRLTTHLVSMYRAGLGPISLKLDVQDVRIDVKRAIPCGLIITELVSNTLKHAFPDGRKGEIAVEMHPNKGKKYILIVKDDGVGIPEGLDFRETKSLGMKLVLDLVKQINGTFEHSKEKGTEFKIVF